MDSLRMRNAFKPTVLPKGRKPIGVRWVYAYKYNPDGSIIRGKEKARLVAQGFSQRPEDFDETYAPVAKMTSIRIILAFAAVNDLEIMASDVKTAFLHCRLRSDIYCRPIPGQPPLPELYQEMHPFSLSSLYMWMMVSSSVIPFPYTRGLFLSSNVPSKSLTWVLLPCILASVSLVIALAVNCGYPKNLTAWNFCASGI
jgi:hypothetical protein